MSDFDDDVSAPVEGSASQRLWVKFARTLRDELEKQITRVVSKGSGSAISEFVEACQAALWLEANAASFDSKVDRMCKEFD